MSPASGAPPRTERRASPLHVSKDGLLFLCGHATSLRVERGHLVARTGEGRHIAEGRFSRVSRPRLRRVVVFGRGGWTSWEALEWIDGIGASFAFVSRDGRVVATSAEAGPNQPALRRAQVKAAEDRAGLAIVRELLGEKLRGQLALLERLGASAQASLVAGSLEELPEAASVERALALEARAASAYWEAWREVPVRFARADARRVPEHWHAFGERRSPLAVTSPRNAATPAGAMLNYLYALAEVECRIALLAVGLDPGLGWAHRDAPYRSAAALDLLEALRPAVDAFLLDLLEHRTFSRREFAELRTGQVRLMPELARELASLTLPRWEQEAAAHARTVATILAGAAGVGVRVPGAGTRGVRGKGRATLGRRASRRHRGAASVAGACRECGAPLEEAGRAYCQACLPTFKAERTERLVAAARRVMAEMRASPDDPAKRPEAIAKRVAAHRARLEAARAWEREHPGPYDRETYLREILPRLQEVTVTQIVRATGLSQSYCWQVRAGRRVPHPMYWGALTRITS